MSFTALAVSLAECRVLSMSPPSPQLSGAVLSMGLARGLALCVQMDSRSDANRKPAGTPGPAWAPREVRHACWGCRHPPRILNVCEFRPLIELFPSCSETDNLGSPKALGRGLTGLWETKWPKSCAQRPAPWAAPARAPQAAPARPPAALALGLCRTLDPGTARGGVADRSPRHTWAVGPGRRQGRELLSRDTQTPGCTGPAWLPGEGRAGPSRMRGARHFAPSGGSRARAPPVALSSTRAPQTCSSRKF